MREISIPVLPRALRWAGVLAVAAVIFYFSLLDAVTAPAAAGPWWDKELHFLGYTALALATAYATTTWRTNPLVRYGAVVLAVVGYGVLIEFLQAPLPARHYSTADMLADAVGTLAAVVVWYGVERYGRRFSLPRK